MKRFNIRPLNIALLAIAASSMTVFAEETVNPAAQQPSSPAENKTHQLETIVVTASGFEQKVTDAPASITVISEEDLKTKRISSLADALRDVEGVEISPVAGKTGGLNIKIRGAESAYTLVLVDGRRQNSTGDIAPNGFGESNNSFIPPVSAIERIEVIRGPMSTLYGSDAMGGVINIITKKVSDVWTGTVKAEATFLPNSSEFGNQYAGEVFLTGPIIQDLAGIQLRARTWNRNQSDLKRPNTNIALPVASLNMGNNPTKGTIDSYGVRFTLTPFQNHEFVLDVDTSEQWYDNSGTPPQLSQGVGPAQGYDRALEMERNKYLVAHTWHSDFGTLDTSLSQNESETRGRLIPARAQNMSNEWRDRNIKSEDTILESKFSTNYFNKHNLVVGVQYWDASISDNLRTLKEVSFDQYGLFAENTWQALDNVAITVGGRFDDHSSFGDFFTPRAYVVWNANDYLTLKGGYSEGYKVPRLDQLTMGAYNVGSQGAQPILGNPNLKPETSDNAEIGIYFDSLDKLKANITYFQNKIKNKITTAGAPYELLYNGRGTINPGNTPVLFDCTSNRAACDAKFAEWGLQWSTQANDSLGLRRPYNAESSETEGVELGLSYQFTPDVKLSANYTWTTGETKTATGVISEDTSNPEHMANLALSWNTFDNATLWVRGEYRSEMFRSEDVNYIAVGLGDYPAYTQFHIGSNIDLTQNVELGLAVFNVFDKNFVDWVLPNGATEYVNKYRNTEEGRRFQISTTFKF